MKKILLASTMLLGAASMASADVKLSGYGRFGLVYAENSGGEIGSDTTVYSRLRFNIDASTETDTGVTFGGRVRIQSTTGSGSGSNVNSGLVYASYNGLRVEVGNTNEASDSVGLFYDSELGFLDSSTGDARSTTDGPAIIESYSSSEYSNDHVGLFTSYTVGDLNVYASYLQLDQYTDNVDGETDQASIAADYKYGQFSIAAAYVDGVGYVEDATFAFVGVAYAVNDVANVGLNYYDEASTATTDGGVTYTLYGNYKMDAITLRGYVANNTASSNEDDTVYGVGADYALGGGARLSGSVQTNYDGNAVADVGVRFNF